MLLEQQQLKLETRNRLRAEAGLPSLSVAVELRREISDQPRTRVPRLLRREPGTTASHSRALHPATTKELVFRNGEQTRFNGVWGAQR